MKKARARDHKAVLGCDYGGLWKENVLYRFRDGNDGTSPRGTLIVDASGNLYGTALGGGVHMGVVFAV
jgi:hypothetical protein